MENKVVLIMGATSMIGNACAKVLAKQGVKLMLVARNSNKLAELAREIPGQIEYCVRDLKSEDDIQFIIDKTIHCFHQIDALIYNVAIYPWKKIDELSLLEWNQTLHLNFTLPFLFTQACFHMMKQQKSGRIILISSIAGEIIGLPHMAAYATSKAGINGLMRTAALEFAPYHITVNSISPGKMYDPKTLNELEIKTKIAPVPLQRFIGPQDIANMAAFLLSNKAKNITGQNLIIDGGQSIVGENAHIQDLLIQ
jgi:3-oxoacyl-[acyl-carrier protein] reductase